jgi:hypothetical protein
MLPGKGHALELENAGALSGMSGKTIFQWGIPGTLGYRQPGQDHRTSDASQDPAPIRARCFRTLHICEFPKNYSSSLNPRLLKNVFNLKLLIRQHGRTH